MTKPITKPITRILKPIIKPIKDILKPKIPKPNNPLDVPQQPTANMPTTITTADIKPNDPRKNMSEQEILANRKKKYRTRLPVKPGASLLTDQQYITSTNFSNTIG